MGKWDNYLLVTIFFLVLFSRLYFAFETPYFSGDRAYFNLRQVEHISEKGRALFDDPLSYSGRTLIFSPVFHYVLALFDMLLSQGMSAKLVPNIFASSLIFFVYLISKQVTNHRWVSLFTSFFSGFIPVFFANTYNSVSTLTLSIPLMFLLVYSFIKINNKKWLYCYLITLIVLSFVSPLILIFMLSLVIYLLILLAESLKLSRAEVEVSLFSIFFILWSQFLIYKEIFLFHGAGAIWQNIPRDILTQYFTGVTILDAIYQIGLLPVVFGTYIIYKYLFKEKNKEVLLLISFAIASGLLLWLRLIQLKAGLMLLGIVLLVLFSNFYSLFVRFISKTRFYRYSPVFSAFLFVIFIITSVYPSFLNAQSVIDRSVTNEEINALLWLRENTNKNSVVLATVEEGNHITSIANRKNVIDTNFLMRENAEQRYEEVGRIYTTHLEIEAVDLLENYEVDYIYLSENARRIYGIDTLSYVGDGCIKKVFENELVSIFHRPAYCEVRIIA